jgi:hypothetical protein
MMHVACRLVSFSRRRKYQIAVAQADGHLDAEEVDVIMDYVRAEGARKGVTKDEAARAEFRRYIERLQPCGSVLMPALKWLRLLINNIPDKYEHLVRYHGYLDSAITTRLVARYHDGPNLDIKCPGWTPTTHNCEKRSDNRSQSQ